MAKMKKRIILSLENFISFFWCFSIFVDQDHELEFSMEEFKQDILISKLKITEIFAICGEIWTSFKND